MKIGIFDVGNGAPSLAETYGSFPEMFIALMAGEDLKATYEIYAAEAGIFPRDISACQAWVIMGSPFSAYDDMPWIHRLEALIPEIAQAKIPLIGICFGHQLIAKALGGRVEKAKQGWEVGVKHYKIYERPSWMKGGGNTIGGFVFHQDQVVALPSNARNIAGNAACTIGMVVYDQPIFTLQSHPEFTKEFAAKRYRTSQGKALRNQEVADALASLDQPTHNPDVARWFGAFLKSKSPNFA